MTDQPEMERTEIADPSVEGGIAQLLFEAAPDAMIAIDAAGRIRFVNHQAEILFGYDKGEMLGQFVELLIPERYRQRHVLHRDGFWAYPRLRPMGLGLNLYGITKSGTEFPVEISLSPLPDGKLTVATVRDVTAWRRIVQRGSESEVTNLFSETTPALQIAMLAVWTVVPLVILVVVLAGR